MRMQFPQRRVGLKSGGRFLYPERALREYRWGAKRTTISMGADEVEGGWLLTRQAIPTRGEIVVDYDRRSWTTRAPANRLPNGD